MENMTYMTSSASNSGYASITVYFKRGSDPDMAAVNVQNRVSQAQSLLPAEVTRVGVAVEPSVRVLNVDDVWLPDHRRWPLRRPVCYQLRPDQRHSSVEAY